jgi:hypothetical protein
MVQLIVITMYSKNRGKAGAHSWVADTGNIRALSYIVVQLYKHSHHRQFKMVHCLHAGLGTFQFGHLPSNSFLALIPAATAVATFRTHIEVGVAGMKIYKELVQEKLDLAKAVASLNTIWHKGKVNISIFTLVEEDGVKE